MKGRLIMLIYCLLVNISIVTAQHSKITGNVISGEDQLPIVGATILVKGTTTGSITDINGNFTLNIVPEGKILIISYVGMKTQEVQALSTMKITMHPDTEILEEVIVTAMGISREKKSLGYTAQEVSDKALTQAKESNFLNSLSGKVAGVRITNSQGDMGSSRIIIRGETSISGENQPLFIIDGIPVDNSQLNTGGNSRDFKNAIADLNPEDIESMSVLKGPNAAALYGSRAAHGVVIVKTKSGKGKKGLGIDIHSSTQFTTILSLPDFQNAYGQGANGKFSYVDGKGGGINDGVDESWGPRLDAGLMLPQFDSPVVDGVRQATPWVSNPDNVRDFFELGYTLNNGVAITNSDDKFDFRLAYNYEKQNSIVPGSEARKTNISFNANYKVTRQLSVGATANYIITNAPNLPGGPFGQRAAGVMLQYLWFGRQVSDQSLKEDYTRSWNSSYYSNPYWRAYYNTTSQKRHRIIGDIHLNYELMPGLDFSFRTGTDYYNDRRKYKIKYGTSGTPYGSYAEDAYIVNENNTEAMIHYTKNINEDFSVDALAGFNVRNKTIENNFQKAPRLAVADLYTLANSRDPLTSYNSESKLRNYGAFASAQVGFRSYAYLNITGRNDWSSTLPVDKNSYFYPSASLSLILTDMLNIKSRTLNFLKIRGGWSQVGNDADPYQLYNTFTSEAPYEGNAQLTTSKVQNNDQLKPEITSSTEFGAEIGLFNNRLHLDATYYHTISRNQILSMKTTAASGYTSRLVNAGKISNKGLELQLTATPVQSKDFNWKIGINYASNKSRVEKLDDEGLIKSYTIYTSSVEVLATVGEAYGTLFGTAYLRDNDGNILVDAKGLPKADPTKRVLGKFTPDWTGGISNTFSYKNLSLSFLIDASFGGSVFSGTNRTGEYTGVLASTLPGRGSEFGGISYYYPSNNTDEAAIAGASSPNGETIYTDGMVFQGVTDGGVANDKIISAEKYYKASYNILEKYVYSSEYVKLRELTFTYRLPQKWTNAMKMTDASISLTGRNLWTIHKDCPNIDPETAFGTGNGQGIESLSLPTVRTFGINISVKF